MKNLLLTLFLLGILCTVYGQDTELFSVINDNKGLSISSIQQERLTNIRNQRMNKNVTEVRIAPFASVYKDGIIPLSIPGRRGKLVAQTTLIEYISDSEFTWEGEIGKEKGTALLMARNGQVFGHFRFEDKSYLLEYLENGQGVIIEQDMNDIAHYSCQSELIDGNAENRDTGIENGRVAGTNSHNVEVRVLVLFTTNAQNTGINMANQAALSVQELNSIKTNSGVTNAQLRYTLAGTQHLNSFTESGQIDEDLPEFRDNPDVIAFREEFQADLVILFTGDNYGNAKGAAWTGPSNENAFGIVVVNIALSLDGFAHETGHLSGANHQLCTVNITGQCSFNAGEDNHGHGFTKGIFWWKKQYRTVMHEPLSGWTLVSRFSNPSVDYDGKPTGVSGQSNVAQNFRDNAHILADFEDFTPPVSAGIIGDDYISSSEWGVTKTYTAYTSNGTPPYTYQWCRSYDGVTYYCNSPTSNNTMNVIFYPGQSSNQYIRMTVTDAGNDTHTSFKSIYVEGGTFPAAARTDEMSENSSTLGNESFNIFPNPADEQLKLSYNLSRGEDVLLTVSNLEGKNLIEKKLVNQKKGFNMHELDLTRLSAGTYMVIITGSEDHYSLRFYKE